ncbi:SurA N-terminal domain-containing protein [Bradyrhizobium neotropicale]|uniref:SurA N-domain family protein n=1 Tax=Bradyrhizobium neotropicale TaxID=1497615 RepID=A0A176ZCK0_9BRAD|nr:SurA N-terminal domain-containing protein [Bradyrhizobium neotropicale]OAF18360.1 SurA N- domain family protein [Bradyrhizobium neotropicale]
MRATTMTTTPLSLFRLLVPVLGAGLILIGTPAATRAQNIVVMVNGDPITDFDIEQRSKLDQLTTQKTPSRQDVINELIEDKVKIKEGKKYGVDPAVADIDQSYAGMAQRMRVSPDQLTKSLEVKGVRPETLKSRMKAEMVWTSLVRGRYKERLQVGERDVAEKVKSEGGEKLQVEGTEYKMQPIVLIVPRGSSQAFIEQRHKEAETYRGRVGSCEEANSLFRSTPNAAIRESVTKTTADLPEALRKVLDDTPIGHLTPPEMTKQGIEMVVLCSRKPTTIDTPKKREIREKMYAEKYEKTSKAYLDEIRKAAMIEYRNR